jgi:hypothetical protein
MMFRSNNYSLSRKRLVKKTIDTSCMRKRHSDASSRCRQKRKRCICIPARRQRRVTNRIVHSIVHDLRSPFTAIRAASEILDVPAGTEKPGTGLSIHHLASGVHLDPTRDGVEVVNGYQIVCLRSFYAASASVTFSSLACTTLNRTSHRLRFSERGTLCLLPPIPFPMNR